MNIWIVPPLHVDQVWSRVSEGLERACAATGGDISTGDLWQQCRSGMAFLVIAHEDETIRCASVWRPEQWSTGRKLRCLALYGAGAGLPKWIRPLRTAVLQLMKDCGARSLVADGLDKWGALFSRLFPNAKRVRVLYEEEVC